MIPLKGLRLRILLLVICSGVGPSSAHASGDFGSVDELVNSMTNGVIQILENLQNSHGENLGNVLILLLERVRQYNVTEDEANIIRDAIALVDDPKAKEILDIVGKVNALSSLIVLVESVYRLLFGSNCATTSQIA